MIVVWMAHHLYFIYTRLIYFTERSLSCKYICILFQIFQGNTDVFTVVRRNLDPAIMARYIRVHPGYYTSGNTVCMRLELYGCVPVIEKGL